MKQFFTRNTVEAQVWCKVCRALTTWKITGGRPQHCIPCFDKLEAGHKQPQPAAAAPAQKSLFGGQ